MCDNSQPLSLTPVRGHHAGSHATWVLICTKNLDGIFIVWGNARMSENNGTPHRNPGGRPSKSIREGMEVIVKALRVGASRAAAAACARIDEGTLNKWMERYPNFD